MDYPYYMRDIEVSRENPFSIIKETELVTLVSIQLEVTGKRTHSDAMGTEEEESS